MSLDEYQLLSGIKVPSSREFTVTAQLGRTQSMLESLLGFSLEPELVTENLYIESGKTNGFSCPIDGETLLPPDPVVGAYRLYPYNDKDQIIAVDPFSTVHAVKLVHGTVTVLTFDHYRAEVGRSGVAKYIELSPWWYRYFDVLWFQRSFPFCTCGQNWQLAVDADWLWPLTPGTPDLPQDLQYVWADMVTYYANQKRKMKSETVGSHTYSQALTVPQDDPENLAVIKRYAGPFGSVTPVVVA
jgi:hypothetical protein